jgi:ligand-binding SRPBCC domain-containing protein
MSTPPICTERQVDGMFRLTTTVLLPDTAERVFQFLSDTNNLEIVVPPWLGLRTLTSRPIDMGIATRIDYRLRIHGVPARWESEVISWEPPRRFVYEQRRGPFRYWMHEHTSWTARTGQWLATTSTTPYPAVGSFTACSCVEILSASSATGAPS